MSANFISWEEAVVWLVSQPDKQKLVHDCYYDPSLEEAVQRYWNSLEWKEVRSFLPANCGRALDLGAGRGIASFALAKDGWDVVAVEPDPGDYVGSGAIRKIAESERLPIEVIQEFGEKIPCESTSFDLVFARQVLHHAHDLPGLCAEVFRVLKPGGKFIAVRDHVISSPSDLPAFHAIHALHQLYGGENAFMLKQYLFALRNAGFRIERVLRPFDSIINYAPHTRDSLRKEIVSRLSRFPFSGIFARMLNLEFVMSAILVILSRMDRRPGRLYSFVCFRPEE